jgi:hypothetical protein
MSNRDFPSLKAWSVANARIYFEEVRNMNLHGKVALILTGRRIVLGD